MNSWESIVVKIAFAASIAASAAFLAYAGVQVAWNGDRLTQLRKEVAGNPAAPGAPTLDLPQAQRVVDGLSAQAFMTADNQAAFLDFLKTAPGDGIEADVHLAPRETNGGLVRIPMRLDVKADFPRLVRYLSRLERSSRYFFVTGVKTSQSKMPDSASATVDASIDGYVYWR